MRKVLIAIALVLLVTSSLFAAQDQSAKRAENILAVLNLETVGKVDRDVARPLTDSVRYEIVKSGKYEVMERGNMDKILKEQAFQMTGCTSKECAVEAGQLLGVGKIVVGSVSLVGKTYLLSLSLVNIETGQVEQVEDQECKCEVDDLIQLSRQVAGKLMGMTLIGVAPVEAKPIETAPQQKPECVKTDGRFCDHGDGTVSDTTTGLLWQQADDGEEKQWNDAMLYCSALNLSNKRGWRLPNVEELKSIAVRSRRKKSARRVHRRDGAASERGGEIFRSFFPSTGYEYWSSTESFPYRAEYVMFPSGSVDGYYKSNKHFVRCVHGRQ